MFQVGTPLAFVSTTVAATALGFANIVVSGTVMFSVPPGADLVVMVCESSPIRWRDDGTSPSVSSGVLIMPTQPAFEYAGDPRSIQFISAATTATLSASFYRLQGS
jgi:hypothetical protein